MAKITIKDLPRDVKVTREEMRRVLGGSTFRICAQTDRSTVLHSEPTPYPNESSYTTGYHVSDSGYVIVY